MKCLIEDDRARTCQEGYNCYRCGFEVSEARRRKHIPLTPAVVGVPFTNFETEETTYVDFAVKRKVIPKKN